MKRYELKKIADGGCLYIEESDILEVRARAGDPLHPVELHLRNRDVYRPEEGFRYDGRRQSVTLRLSLRQARELVEQDRAAAGKEYCEECYDFGKSTDPEACARCRTLLALMQAGQGDLRKIRVPLPRPESQAQPLAIAILFIALWVALTLWARSAQERDRARAELIEVRREYSAKKASALPQARARSR